MTCAHRGPTLQQVMAERERQTEKERERSAFHLASIMCLFAWDISLSLSLSLCISLSHIFMYSLHLIGSTSASTSFLLYLPPPPISLWAWRPLTPSGPQNPSSDNRKKVRMDLPGRENTCSVEQAKKRAHCSPAPCPQPKPVSCPWLGSLAAVLPSLMNEATPALWSSLLSSHPA